MKSQASVTIVDDEEGIRKALRRLLESEGMKVATFDSAEAFLDKMDHTQADCLVLDVRLSGLNGFELHERIRSGGRHIPTIFMTAYRDIPAGEQATKAGAVGVLEKPFDAEDLLGLIQKALEQGGTGAA